MNGEHRYCFQTTARNLICQNGDSFTIASLFHLYNAVYRYPQMVPLRAAKLLSMKLRITISDFQKDAKLNVLPGCP